MIDDKIVNYVNIICKFKYKLLYWNYSI